MQVQAITQKLDPARLGASADAATGAPIVGADGLVESGNARTIAMKPGVPGRRAGGRRVPRLAARQRGAVRSHARADRRHGEADAGAGRTTPVDRAEFARQANAPTVAAMSPVEQACSDAKRIDAMDDLQPDEQGDFATSRDHPPVRRTAAAERADRHAGRRRAVVEQRLRPGAQRGAGWAYGDSPVLTRMVESMNDDMRNVSRALMIAAPRVAHSAARSGRAAASTPTSRRTWSARAEELARLKERGTSVDDALAQSGLLGDEFRRRRAR